MSPLAEISARLREAIASRDLDRISDVLQERARVFAEHAASASAADLASAQADNRELADLLADEKIRLVAGVGQSQCLQKALSQNLPIRTRLLGNTLG
jgi:hypothetical protein